MTVPASDRKAGPYVGNGVQNDFSFGFKVFTEGDVSVTRAVTATGAETALTLDSDYSVTLNVDQNATPGGVVRYPISGAKLPSTETLAHLGALAYGQGTDIPDGGDFNASNIEDSIDKQNMLIQQLKEKVGRAVLVTVSSGNDPQLLIGTLLTATDTAVSSAASAVVSRDAAAASAASINPSAVGGAVLVAVDEAAARTAISAAEANATRGMFAKADTLSVGFTKTAAGTVSIKAGTYIDVAGTLLSFVAATAVVMPALTAGTDYAIYACTDGTVRADSSFTNPIGYTIANSRLIGGFHYGLVAPGTTLVGGSFNTAGSVQTGGMVWTQGQVDDIAGINKYSLWDLKWRANVSDLRAQKGFVLTAAGNWVAIYYASTDCDTNGLSKYNTDVASGSVLAKIPAAVGGNGVLTYADGNWWRFSELARAYGARLLTDAEASVAFFGVTENQSLGGVSVTNPATARQAGYTSKYGVEQATGHHWTWGDDSSGTTSTAYVVNGGRGWSYTNLTIKVLLGGARADAAASGSRASYWSKVPTSSGWDFGLRAACDHLMLA